MRLLQLAIGPDEQLDLHPNVTVVAGLDDASHAVLVDAVERLARSEAATGGGLLEAHGVLFDLDPALLAVVERADGDLDPIVHPGQLPTQPISVDARELRNREQAFAALLEQIATQAEKQSLARGAVAATAAALEDARRARADADLGAGRRLDDVDRLTRRLDHLTEQRRRSAEELAEVGPALDAAQATRAEVEGRTAAVRETKRAALARQSGLDEELAAIDVILDPSSGAEVQRAAEALAELEAEFELDRAREADEATADEQMSSSADLGLTESATAAARLERLDARDRELEALLIVVTPVERIAIEEALAMLQGGEAADRVPSTAAAALADQLDQISAELGDPGAGAGVEVASGSLAGARARLDDARETLLEAEQAVRNPELNRDDVLELEDTHAELIDAMEKADGRFAGARARGRVAELRSDEQEVLDRLGFTSYSAYMMGSSLVHVDPEKEAALRAARVELSAAEDDWRRLEQETEAALARAAVLDRRRALFEEAQHLLGRAAPGGRPQEALRALLVPAVSVRDAAARLQASLDAVGVDVGDEELDNEELALMAEAWLAEADQVDGRRQRALEERASIQPERTALRAELALDGSGVDGDGSAAAQASPDPEDLRQELLAEARRELTAAEARHAAAQAAEARRAAVAADRERALVLARAASEAAAEADGEMAAALAAEAPLAERAAALSEELGEVDRELVETDDALEAMSGVAPDPAALDAALANATARHADALASVEVEDQVLASLDAQGREAALEIERLQDIVTAQGSGTATPAEELEWYLLARLAAQRSVSIAGSLPLLLDDALRGLDGEEVSHLLGRLERMAEAVQVIIVSDDPVVAAWAADAGPARAAVVSPVAP